jgi:threonine/homoserine/homoserine lactone efflux protein
MKTSAIAALLLASLVIMGSPGPSTVSATAMGAAFGIRRSLRYVGGLIAGTTAVLLAVAVGVVALLFSVPQVARLLTAASAFYILYLAWQIATAPPLDASRRDLAAPAFAGGFLLAIANPKAYFAIAAVFAGTTIFPAALSDAAAKFALLAIMIVLIHFAWLLVGAALSRLLHDPLISRIINVTLAVALVALTALAVVG